MKKILISDYDDTFFTNESELLKNMETINSFRKKNNLFVIATARSWNSIKEEIKKYNIKYDYILCNMGAGIFDNKGNKLYANYISKKEKEEFEKILERSNTYSLKTTRFGIPDEQEKDSSEVVGYKFKGDVESLEELKNKVDSKFPFFEITLKKEQEKLFINHKTNTKENGIKKLYDLLPKDDYKIITIGDDDVDYNMIKIYDGYRMEKSSELLSKNVEKKAKAVREII